MWRELSSGVSKEASNNWVYCDGQVAVGPLSHSQLLHSIGPREIGDPWAYGYNTPVTNHSIARGYITDDGHVAFLETNTDRNTVKDAVKRNLNA